MQNQIKLTTAQAITFHSAEATFFGALVVGAISVYQAVATGNYSVPSLLSIFIPVVVAALAKGLSLLVNNPTTIQAEGDTLALFDRKLTDMYNSLLSQIAAQPAPIVHIHNDVPPVPVAPSPAPATPVTPVPVQPAIQINPPPGGWNTNASSSWQSIDPKFFVPVTGTASSTAHIVQPVQEPFSPTLTNMVPGTNVSGPTLASLIPAPIIPVSIHEPAQNISEASTQVVPSVASAPDRWSTASLQAMNQTQG